ncbi:MAG: hypothetical protein FWD49_03590 [Firmicutes bacterium]|nr:hypothetical protein [Bacillota bacterium]
MARKILILGVVLVMSAFVATVLCACADQAQGIMLRYSFEESAYDIDDVSLRFYFGISQGAIDNRRGKNNAFADGVYAYDNIQLFFYKAGRYEAGFDNRFIPIDLNDPNIFFISEIAKEEFYGEKYLQNNFRGRDAVYNHSEMIKIPTELFEEEAGTLFFCLRINKTLKATGEYISDNHLLPINYRIGGEEVYINPNSN